MHAVIVTFGSAAVTFCVYMIHLYTFNTTPPVVELAMLFMLTVIATTLWSIYLKLQE